ncbi:MAG: sortase [Actinomycetota bacterium]|nr:sortase [Actinomycetota bacterium]
MQLTAGRVFGIIGRTLIGAGVIVGLFLVYQLWGTGLQEARAQDQLDDEFAADRERFEELISGADDTTSTTAPDSTTSSSTSSTTSTTAAPTTTTTVAPEILELLQPDLGEAIGSIDIPKIGLVDKKVVEGTGEEELKLGPGRDPRSQALPGLEGNAAIAGHRTTWGAPFNRIDELVPGDTITVTTLLGEATYEVTGTEIVLPTQVEVLGEYGDNRLTLIACHPKYSARERIVVTAHLVGDPFEDPTAPATTTTTAPPTTTPDTAPDDASTSTTLRGGEDPDESGATDDDTADDLAGGLGGDASGGPAGPAGDDLGEGLSGDLDDLGPALLWAAVTAIIGIGAWLVAKLVARNVERRRRWIPKTVTYALAVPAMLVPLYVCFSHVDAMLPAY